jgi:hypothetical protein
MTNFTFLANLITLWCRAFLKKYTGQEIAFFYGTRIVTAVSLIIAPDCVMRQVTLVHFSHFISLKIHCVSYRLIPARTLY